MHLVTALCIVRWYEEHRPPSMMHDSPPSTGDGWPVDSSDRSLTHSPPLHPPHTMPLQPSSDAVPDLQLALTPSLHPHLVINADAPPGDCRLYLALTLPDALFPDPDELTDLWGPSDSNSAGVRWSLSPRRIDIERPVDSSLKNVRLDVSVPSPPVAGQAVADIPLHARYLPPSENDGWDVSVFDVENPVRAAWACNGQCKLGSVECKLTSSPGVPRRPRAAVADPPRGQAELPDQGRDGHDAGSLGRGRVRRLLRRQAAA